MTPVYDRLQQIEDCIAKIRESLEQLAEENRKAICGLTADEPEADSDAIL